MDELQHSVIIVHPEFEALKADVARLRVEISMLVLERDQLLYQECPHIEMTYMLSIGTLEYRAYEIECLALRLKRKAELIQAKRNRQEKVALPEIEAILDTEFAAYQEALAEQLGNVTAALERSRLGTLSESETAELRKLYHSVVKELHPDLHPDIGEDKLHLFRLAVDAYKSGDLRGLRAIHVMTAAPVIPEQQSDAMSFLTAEKARLTDTLDHLRRDIERIQSQFPYTMREIINSPEKTAARKAELESRITALNDIVAAYSQRIETLLR